MKIGTGGPRTLASPCVLAVVLATGCGRSGSPPGEEPTPDDEVSVGYGTQSDDDVTGAISSISAAEARSYEDVGEMLEGRVPGLQLARLPNGDYQLRIRGGNVFSASNEPLLVIDGMPIPSGRVGAVLATMDPGVVERIDVLKDVGSTAIYGSRGFHGVIIITTRQAP